MKKIRYNTKLKALLLGLLFLIIFLPAKSQNYHWTPNKGISEDFMTITGYITKDGTELTGSNWEIACFIGDECRGRELLTQANQNGHQYLCFCGIWGGKSDNGKPVTFRLYDHNSGVIYEGDPTSILFEDGGDIGRTMRDDLYHFSISSMTYMKAVIESAAYNIAQKDGNTEAGVKAWLANQINKLLGAGIFVTANDITINGFNVATEGNEVNQAGTDGSFNFTVNLTKEGQAGSMGPINGVIKATPYGSVGFESVAADKLQVAVSDNGIRISGIVLNETVKFYNTQGMLLFQKVATETTLFVPLSQHGVYIITNAERQAKIIF